jgi:hypothetical protein
LILRFALTTLLAGAVLLSLPLALLIALSALLAFFLFFPLTIADPTLLLLVARILIVVTLLARRLVLSLFLVAILVCHNLVLV